MFYLDTNAARSLIKKIKETDLKQNASTSLLVLFEVISGFKDIADLKKRATIAKRLIASGIAIDYEPAENKLIRSFQGLVALPNWEIPVKELISILNSIESTDEIESAIVAQDLAVFWTMITDYDKFTGKDFAVRFHEAIQRARHVGQGLNSHWNDVASNISSWARQFCGDPHINPNNIGIEELIAGFDGSPLLYLYAGNMYLDMVINGRMDQNQEIFEKILEDKVFGDFVKELMMKKIYKKLNE